jgi:HlyD family secretion protein
VNFKNIYQFKNKKQRWGVLGTLFLLIFCAFLVDMRTKSPPVEPQYTQIAIGNMSQEVVLVGSVNYQAVVPVGAQVSGVVKAVHVDYNTDVQADQLLAVIDPDAVVQRLKQAQADLVASKASLHSQQLTFEKMQSDFAELERDFARLERLHAAGAIAGSELDRAKSNVRGGAIGLQSTKTSLEIAMAGIQQKEAVVQQMQVEVGRTEIRSPVEGRVIRRMVEKGQTISAQTQSPELFLIARDTARMQIQATVDEVDVAKIHIDMPAIFTTEAFRGQKFQAQVLQIRNTPMAGPGAGGGVTGVAQYQVLLSFDDPEQKFLQGMTATVRVQTQFKQGVMQVPNAALHALPPAHLQDALKLNLSAHGRGLRVLYRQMGQNQWQAVPVLTGLSNPEMTEVMLPSDDLLSQPLSVQTRAWFQPGADGVVLRWQAMSGH